jgi:uncharacterized protein (TIGR01244 family)
MESRLAAIASFRRVGPEMYASGQPAPEDWPLLRACGVRSVVNLRTASEQPGASEQGAVESAGLAYAPIPVADGNALSRGLVAHFHQALQSLAPPWLVHCASANRVGAMLALHAAWHGGLEPDAALELGRRAGLTSLEPMVRQHLGLPGE